MIDHRDRVDSKVELTFCPHWLIRHPHLQTTISSLRKCHTPYLNRAAQMMILEVEEGVQLQGLYSPQRHEPSKGLVLLLHGWLGCYESAYVLALGEHLYRHHYDILRLNLRDHGGTCHLNSGIFRGDLIDEVFAATRQIAYLAGDNPLHLVGFSLGGNFVLRIAWQHSQSPLPNLHQTIAVCPAIDPCHTTLNLDKNRFYLEYFRRRWTQAFQTKQRIFPDLYDFSKELAASTCLGMTEAFVSQCCPQESLEAYFGSYTITPEMMCSLNSPVTILAAADDPVVSKEDFDLFYNLSPQLEVKMQPYGGHVGFIDIFPFRYWINEFVSTILENNLTDQR